MIKDKNIAILDRGIKSKKVGLRLNKIYFFTCQIFIFQTLYVYSQQKFYKEILMFILQIPIGLPELAPGQIRQRAIEAPPGLAPGQIRQRAIEAPPELAPGQIRQRAILPPEPQFRVVQEHHFVFGPPPPRARGFVGDLVQFTLSGGIAGNTQIAGNGNGGVVIQPGRNQVGNVAHSITTNPILSFVGAVLDGLTR